MLNPSGLADAIALVESRVRSGERIEVDQLAEALHALDQLQGDPAGRSAVAHEARCAQHWLGQYIAALIDTAAGALVAGREAKLRALTLGACERLRIAIARSWVGAQ